MHKTKQYFFGPSVQFKVVSMCSEKPVHALYPIAQKFLQRCLWNSSNELPLKQFQWVWVTMALTRPFKEDHLALPLSTQVMVWCPWLCAHRYCLQPLVTAALPASLPAQSSPFAAACPGQHTRQSICSVISLHSSTSRAAHPPVYLLSHLPSQQHVQGSTPASLSAQSSPFTAAHPPVYLLSHLPSQQHVQGSTPASLSAQSSPFTAACPGQHTRQSTCSVISLHSSMSRAAHPQSFQRGMSTNDTFQPGLPFPLFVTSWLNLWGWRHVVRLTLLEENQWRAWVTAFTFTVKLHNSKKHLIFIPMIPTSSSCANQFKSYRQLKLPAIKSPTLRNWPVEIWSHTAVSS